MGQLIQEPKWLADDGEKFDTEDQMLAHEASTKYQGLVDSYLGTLEPMLKTRMDETRLKSALTRSENAVLPFLAWLQDKGYLSPQALTDAQALQAQVKEAA